MEIHELARKIRRLSRGDDTSNTDILPALRQLKTYEELDVVGHALEKVQNFKNCDRQQLYSSAYHILSTYSSTHTGNLTRILSR